MINALLFGIVSFVVSIFSSILQPLLNGLGSYFNQYSGFVSYITNFLSYCLTCVGWVINSLGLSPVMNLVILYWVGVLTLAIPVRVIKIVLRWYRILMP